MTIVDTGGYATLSVRQATVTGLAEYPKLPEHAQAHPLPVRVVVDEAVSPDPTDDALMRTYLSHLWSEDWDSDEDGLYDTW